MWSPATCERRRTRRAARRGRRARCCSRSATAGVFAARRWARRAIATANAVPRPCAARSSGPTTALLSEEERGRSRRGCGAVARVDRRSARRHARIWRGRGPTGRCMSRWRSTASRRSARWRCRGSGSSLRSDRAAAAAARAGDRCAWSSAARRPATRSGRGGRGARRRAGADGLGGRQGDGGGARRGRHLPPLRRAI